MLSLDSVTNIDTFSFDLNNIECGFKNSLLNLNSDTLKVCHLLKAYKTFEGELNSDHYYFGGIINI